MIINQGGGMNSFSFKRDSTPLNIIDKLQKLLIPLSGSPFELRERQTFELSPSKEKSGIILLTEGVVTIHNYYTKNHVSTTFSPSVIGLMDCYSILYDIKERPRHYLQAQTQSKFFFVPVDIFLEVADKYSLWHDVSTLLVNRLMFASLRDQELVGVNTYSMIYALLQELWLYPESYRSKKNVQEFISGRCGVSRSQTMKILSDLRKGGYIQIRLGVLTNLNKLPKKY